MPRTLDLREQGFQSEQRVREAVRRRKGRSGCREEAPRRARDRPADPIEVVKANASTFEEAHHVGPSLFPLRPERKALHHLAFWCQERSLLLEGAAAARYADALVALSAHWRDWLRPLDDWIPPCADARAQLGALARHLLARYDVPAFLDAAWLAGLTPESATWQEWFKHIGAGGSIREAEGLPVHLTRRMAHHFLHAPADLDVAGAVRYAQVLGMGGDEVLARSLLATRIGTDFDRDDFWLTVVRWLIEHPEIGPAQHGPLIDYLYDRKYVPSVPSGLGRGRDRLSPPQPHLCMRGRCPDALLREVERWHRSLRWRPVTVTSWKPSGLPAFRVRIEEETGPKVYAVTELLSTQELQEEGAALEHCVASYWPLCRSGEASIWSLTVEDDEGRVARLLTVEVRGWRREIVQARGRCNRLPLFGELHVLSLWAREGGPTLLPGCCLTPG